MSLLMSRPYGYYSKVEKEEDPEEIRHRRAQYLIYKVLEEADRPRRRQSSSCLRIRICKLKFKIGKRLKRLRNKRLVLLTISATRGGLYKQVMSQLRTWKRLFHGGQALVDLPGY